MFLEDFLNVTSKDKKNGVTKLHMQSCTYTSYYKYWLDNLFERIMRLFVWRNTFTLDAQNNVIGVKPKEIEQRVLISGHCGITKIKREKDVTAMWGSFFGISKYMDELPFYMVNSPIYSGKRTIGKDIVVIDNNQLRNPCYPLVHHYATLLAHNEVSLATCMVRLREKGGVPIAKTEKQKQSISDYQTKVFNGQFGQISDVGMFGVDYAGNRDTDSQTLMDLVETRNKLLKSFYTDIGVKSAFEKRSNSIEAEVEADTSMLLFNLSDMLEARKEGCERVNKMFGLEWSVELAPEINYVNDSIEEQPEEVNDNEMDSEGN